MTYTAANIRILSRDEVTARWEWAEAGALAIKYGVPEGWVRRGLKACMAAGVSPDYFIRRYLECDHSVPLDPAVNEQMVRITREARGSAQPR
jgi:hypothetical protein